MDTADAHLIGTGYYADTTIAGVVIGDLAHAEQIADRFTLAAAQNARGMERPTATVFRVVETVDLLDGPEQAPADDEPVARIVSATGERAPGRGRSDHRLYDPDPERVVAGDVVRGSVANLLPRGTAIVVDPAEGRNERHHALLHLEAEANRWGSPSDPHGRDSLVESAWFLVLYVPGR